MEIILKEDIIGLGYKNDIVNVKSGYGRNYLIPQGKGVIASPMAKKILAENLKQQAHKLAAIKAEAEKKAESLNGVALCIAAKVSATGQLYGSVGANQVAEELQKLGKEVDRKIITMKDAKTVGDFVALVHFHKEVTVEVPVKVIAENAAELKAAADEEAAILAAADEKQLLGINLVEGAHSIHHSLEICCFGKHRHVQHASVTLRSQAASAEIECHKRNATLNEIASHLAVVHTRGTETVRKHCNGKWSLPFWILNLPVYAHVIAHDNELFNHLGILPKQPATNVVIVREYIVI